MYIMYIIILFSSLSFFSSRLNSKCSGSLTWQKLSVIHTHHNMWLAFLLKVERGRIHYWRDLSCLWAEFEVITSQRDSRIETFCCHTPQREKPLISQPARDTKGNTLSRHMKEGVQPKINRIQSPRGSESQCCRSVSTQLYQLQSIVTSFSLTLLLCRVHSHKVCKVKTTETAKAMLS